MKIRSDFISNSSTSSFICNTPLSPTEIKDKLEVAIGFFNYFLGTNDTYSKMFIDIKRMDNFQKECATKLINGCVTKGIMQPGRKDYLMEHLDKATIIIYNNRDELGDCWRLVEGLIEFAFDGFYLQYGKEWFYGPEEEYKETLK